MSLKLTCILLCEVAADPVWKVVLVATIEGRLWSSLEPIFFFFRVAVFPLIFLAFTWYFNNNSTIFKFPTQHAKYRTVWPLTSLKFMSNGTSYSLDPEIQIYFEILFCLCAQWKIWFAAFFSLSEYNKCNEITNKSTFPFTSYTIWQPNEKCVTKFFGKNSFKDYLGTY